MLGGGGGGGGGGRGRECEIEKYFHLELFSTSLPDLACLPTIPFGKRLS